MPMKDPDPSFDPLLAQARRLDAFEQNLRPPDARGAVDEITALGGPVISVSRTDGERELPQPSIVIEGGDTTDCSGGDAP
jgi:hypothetical protein